MRLRTARGTRSGTRVVYILAWHTAIKTYHTVRWPWLEDRLMLERDVPEHGLTIRMPVQTNGSVEWQSSCEKLTGKHDAHVAACGHLGSEGGSGTMHA